MTALFTFVFVLFVVGETFTDPGGWKALGLVSAWAVPPVALAALAWFRPNWAIRVFAILVAVLIGISIWFAVNPEGWRSFENRNGPIRDVITFVVAAAVALLGLKRTAMAGVMLLVLGVGPWPSRAWGVSPASHRWSSWPPRPSSAGSSTRCQQP